VVLFVHIFTHFSLSHACFTFRLSHLLWFDLFRSQNSGLLFLYVWRAPGCSSFGSHWILVRSGANKRTMEPSASPFKLDFGAVHVCACRRDVVERQIAWSCLRENNSVRGVLGEKRSTKQIQRLEVQKRNLETSLCRAEYYNWLLRTLIFTVVTWIKIINVC
jgi:hypothetical protein